MDIVTQNLELLSFDVIKKHLVGKNIINEYELEFVRRIIQRDEKLLYVQIARNYFLTDYSSSFLDYIASSICKEENGLKIKGEYFEFISKSDYKTNTPYYKLTLYTAKNQATLLSYVSTITARHFTAKYCKDSEIKKTVSLESFNTSTLNICKSEVIDNPWFNTLIQCEADDVLSKYGQTEQSLYTALQKLPEREQLIIKLMVMGDASALDAFEDLEPYLAQNAKTPTSTWTKKQKQDAMSLLKGRALSHLKKIMKK